MTRNELLKAQVKGLWVTTPFGRGLVNAVGGRWSYVQFTSDEPDTLYIIREIPNNHIKTEVRTNDTTDDHPAR